MDVLALLGVLGGLVLLVGGGDVLVRGAAGLAERLGTPPMVIGLTVVAMGTSTPELAVTLGAALRGSADVALGNVVGSNLFNLLVVLGLTAMLGGLFVERALLRFEAPLLVVLTGLVLLAAGDDLQRWEGVLLLVGAVAFTLVLLRRAKRLPGDPDPLAEPAAAPAGGRSAAVDGGLVVGGLVLLTVGAQLLVDGAIEIATGLGVSEAVIGLTVVAAGTSLPELSTSLVAAAKGQREIAVGNVLGSNLLNLLVVLGAGVAITGRIAVDRGMLEQDLPVLLVAQVALLPLLWVRGKVGRAEGLVLLAGYGAYVLLVLVPRMLG